MVENENKSVATAIGSAELEGFVAGTLYNEGWSVTFRALDLQSLITHLDSSTQLVSLLLISTDIEGLTPQSRELVKSRGSKLFLFTSKSSATELYPEAINQPETALELLGLIRGSLRAPMIRGTRKEKVRARTIAITSPSSSSGCSTLAINLGAELAQLGLKVLIVDAHSYFPTFAIRLGERGITDTSDLRNISHQLWALEVTQNGLVGAISLLERARFEFDYIVIDHGIIIDFPAVLAGRRWCNEVTIWMATYADELWVISKSDLISTERLKRFLAELSRNSIKPELSVIQSLSSSVKRSKSDSETFLQLITPIRPKRVLQYPWDPRSALAAENERCTLVESNERGILRKSIAHIAGELAS